MDQIERRQTLNFLAGAAPTAPRKYVIFVRARQWNMRPWELEKLLEADPDVQEWFERANVYDTLEADEAKWRLKRTRERLRE